MADPVIVALAADTWTIVATGVTSGQVWIREKPPIRYLHTYVMTGNPAPTDNSKAVPFYNEMIPISASAAIDVYVKAVNVAGEVRVDL